MATRYGLGPYGTGPYGITREPVVAPVVPPPATTVAAPARHFLGIGPTTSAAAWRGAPNQGVKPGTGYPTRPIIGLPPAQSMSFTLRLDGGCEARVDIEAERTAALVIEDMITDLWWHRRDPRRNLLEPIGRFNADTVDVRNSANGISLSATFVDYQGLLEDRLVLEYLDPVTSESMWAAGTPVTQILTFAIPLNTPINLDDLDVDLGTIKEPFELPPGTTIEEVVRNLKAISNTAWEWWVELPAGSHQPKLRLLPGQRGTDKGVVLFHIGDTPSPVTDWQMQTSGDRYANAIFFSGSTGGVVLTKPSEIDLYLQRDAVDSDASLKGNEPLIRAAAQRRLNELAERRPAWRLTLQPGFWEGRSHIDVGDWVTVHIRLGNELLTGTHRVTEITCDIDEAGAETVTLTVGRPRPARDPRSRQSAISVLARRLKNYERKGT
ncbi:MAG: hypothetical protein M3N52_11815 [Actinomycetota bacterium]|nr:hypothetical protein [Actinomycetota bacterium]